jgi:hypothetical protein
MCQDPSPFLHKSQPHHHFSFLTTSLIIQEEERKVSNYSLSFQLYGAATIIIMFKP